MLIGNNFIAISMEVKVVFKRTLTDDPLTASQAFSNYVNACMNPTDALIAAKAVSDPAEVGSRCQVMDINGSISPSSNSVDNNSPETSENKEG